MDSNELKKNIAKIVIGGLLFLLGLIGKGRFEPSWLWLVFLGLAYVVLGYEVAFEAFVNLAKGDFFDENFLMLSATIGAAVLGDYKEAVAVMLFYMIGETAQDAAVDISSSNIEKTMNLVPETVRLYTEQEETIVGPEQVSIGQLFRVFPGERIPLDGILKSDGCSINKQALTGESVPVYVSQGERVLSGSILIDKAVEIICDTSFENSTATRITNLVKDVEANKAPTEKFITRFSKVYTPVVILLAVVIAIIPSIFTGAWTLWLHRALSFLVISCPCALVLSIPLTFFAGIGGSASRGILIKGASHLEALAKADLFVFDKTGTLTNGVLSVDSVKPSEGVEDSYLLSVAFSLEKLSTHPIARAISDYCRLNGVSELKVHDVYEEAGKGMFGKLDNGSEVFCGKGNTSQIYVLENKKMIGSISLSDTVKESAIGLVQKLKTNGVKQCAMLTGDKQENALPIAETLGLDNVYANLLPDEKVRKIEELSKDRLTAYIGDGLNDAPVLAASDVGISIGLLKSDSAAEASGIVVVSDDISKVVDARRIAAKTVSISRQNVIFAIFVKFLCLFLSSIGIGTMAMAVFADVGVCLICVLNALRALHL